MPRKKKEEFEVDEQEPIVEEKTKPIFGKVVLVVPKRYIVVEINGYNQRTAFRDGFEVGDKIEM